MEIARELEVKAYSKNLILSQFGENQRQWHCTKLNLNT
jgi:hypothetical protein